MRNTKSMEEVAQAVKTAVKSIYTVDVEPEISYPKPQFGDYATNVAFPLAKSLKKTPQEVAEDLTRAIKHPAIAETAAANGFINFKMQNGALTARVGRIIEQGVLAGLPQALANKTIVAEYSDPNPFKELHVGHIYTSIVGDAIANLLEAVGARIHRVNFGGDVGRHVAQAMWGILQRLGGEKPDNLDKVALPTRIHWLSEAYVAGSVAYEQDPEAKRRIIAINKRVYELHTKKDTTSDFARIYWTARHWSYEYFDKFYARLGTKFEKYYPESQNVAIGLDVVKEQLKKGVFEVSGGAVIFNGEKFGLHTRVFINSEGLPTYETKDIGVALAKWRDYHFDQSLIISANDIIEYLKVVNKAIEQFKPALAGRTTHIPHGLVKLKGEGKMSSRKGNILSAQRVIEAAARANLDINHKADRAVTLGAVKYALLKQQLGGDILFDLKQSVNIRGNSGPYLQYAYARTQSILKKASLKTIRKTPDVRLSSEERVLIIEISKFSQIIVSAAKNYAPHLLCTYLFDLAQAYNLFYETHRIIGSDQENLRLTLVAATAAVLKEGLRLLGIQAPERL